MGVASIPESTASLVAHVEDAELAAWLLRQAKLTGPASLRVTLPGPEALRHLKGDVHRATTAALACEDLDALDRFARDSRVTIKRVVAARPSLRPDTIERLWVYAHKHNDAEIVAGLIDKVDLTMLSEHLFGENQSRTASLLGQIPAAQTVVLAERLVAAGDWRLFVRAAAASRRYTDAFAAALGRHPVGGTGLEFSDPASPLNDPEASSGVRLSLGALLRSVKHWDRARAGWAVKLFAAQFDPTAPQGAYSVSATATYYRTSADPREEVAVDDDAAELLLSVLDRDVSSLGQLRSRHSEQGAAVALLSRELPSAVASSPRQASRHFDRLCSTDEPEVASTLLWRAVEDRRALSVDRERSMVALSARMELVNTSSSIPRNLGRRVGVDDLLPLLRSGELGITLEWLSGRRFSEPTVEAVSCLVSDPGKAFHSSRYSSRFNSWAREWWAYVPTPGGWRGQSASAAAWFIELQQWLADPASARVLSSEADEVAYLRATVTPQLVVAAVDAAGAAGVGAALGHPAWLVARIRQLVGDSLEVWETLVGLAPEWDQSLTELVSTAALLAGVPLLEQKTCAEAEPAPGTLTQLALM